jgi:hypothetical protein
MTTARSEMPEMPADMKARRLFFWGAPLSSIALLAIVLAYGLASGFDYFTPMSLGTHLPTLPFSFYQIVIVLWFFGVDGSHLFHTMARALMLPDVFRRHRKSILFSFAFFIAGPTAIVWPALMGGAFSLEPGTPTRQTIDSVPVVLLSLYFLWAYWHVTKQHWGFIAIRARLRGQAPDFRQRAFHVFTTALAPAVFFLVDGHVKISASQALSTSGLLSWIGVSKTQVVGAGACAFAAAVFLAFVIRWDIVGKPSQAEIQPDGSSTFLLVSSAALHLFTMSIEPLALFVHPIITLGHDLQYHVFCYFEGKERSGLARKNGTIKSRTESLFYWLHDKRYGIFLAATLFAFASTSPLLLTPFVSSFVAEVPFLFPRADDIRVAVGASTYFMPPPIESQLINALCLGFAAQHYYIDGKIWRFSKDEAARASVEGAFRLPPKNPEDEKMAS